MGTRSDAGGERQALTISGDDEEECFGGDKRAVEAQWNFKPAPDRCRWAQVMEHIRQRKIVIRGMVKEKPHEAPAGEPGAM